LKPYPASIGAQGTEKPFVIAAKLSGKTETANASVTMDVSQRLTPDIRNSIAIDNGIAFAGYGLIRDAYASCQKGAVENMNGWFRRDLPRKRDIDKMSDEELQDFHRRFGHSRLRVLLWREGLGANHKKTHRIYVEEGLQARKRKKRRRSAIAQRP